MFPIFLIENGFILCPAHGETRKWMAPFYGRGPRAPVFRKFHGQGFTYVAPTDIHPIAKERDELERLHSKKALRGSRRQQLEKSEYTKEQHGQTSNQVDRLLAAVNTLPPDTGPRPGLSEGAGTDSEQRRGSGGCG